MHVLHYYDKMIPSLGRASANLFTAMREPGRRQRYPRRRTAVIIPC